MTNLPVEQVRIGKGVEGGVAVRLPPICMRPECHEQMNIETHHVVRRSYLGGPYPGVEIDDLIMPNVVSLCPKHHLRLTVNGAAIVYEGGKWWWKEQDETVKELQPQPVLAYLSDTDLHHHREREILGPADRQLIPKPHGEEKTCPRCHGKGRLPKKEKKLNAPKRKYKTWSMGIPVDAGENGYEIWKDNLEAATERVGAILGYSDTVPPYYVLVAVCSDWLNTTEHEQGGDSP